MAIAGAPANTPTVWRTSYVHDAVIAAFEAGALKHVAKKKGDPLSPTPTPWHAE